MRNTVLGAIEAAGTALGDDARAVIEDARALVEAELAYHKTRAGLAGRGAGRIAALGLAVVALLFFALMAVVVGLLLALTPRWGAWGAMAAVVGGILLLALLCAALALRQVRWVKRVLRQSPTDDPNEAEQ